MSRSLRNSSLLIATAVSLGLAFMTLPAQAAGLETTVQNDSSVVWSSFADKYRSEYPTGPRGGR